MSHFTVLVVTDTPEEVDKVLQPFHEYECTGVDDEYVHDVDRTENVNEHLEKMVFVGKTKESGVWDYQYNEDKAKEKLIDFKHVSMKCYYEIAGFNEDKELEEWFGYEKRGNQWIEHTNPNAKWDWWLIGGRWSGFFTLKEGKTGYSGDVPAIMGGGKSEGIDQALKGDIDYEVMMQAAAEEAAKKYDEVAKIINGRDFDTWDTVLNSVKENIEEARGVYHSQPVMVDLKEAYPHQWGDFDEFKQDRDTYIQNNKISSVSTFAILKDGEWLEKGKMGWFACVSDEKLDWNKNYLDLLNEIPDDKYLTVVDCHI